MQLINSYSLAGAEKLVFDLAMRMNKRKFNVLVCSIGRRRDKIEAEFRERLESNRINTLSLDKPPHKRRLAAIWRLHRYLKKNHVNILHTHCSSPDFYGEIAAFLARTPLVFSTIHSVQGYSTLNERIFKHLTTKYIAISEIVRQYAVSELKIPPKKIEVIYNAIDMDRFTAATVDREAKLKELGIANGGKVITSVGNIAERKGHLYLVEAAGEVVKDFPDVHFLVVGDDHAEPELARSLKEIVKAKRMQNKIIFTGVRADIPKILSITDVFVLPSLWEGLSIALLEAMAAGVPAIVTDVGSNPEVVTDEVNGLIVPPKDSQALAQRIKKLLIDPRGAKRLGLAGQRKARGLFTLDKMVSRYEQLYLHYLEGRQGLS